MQNEIYAAGYSVTIVWLPTANEYIILFHGGDDARMMHARAKDVRPLLINTPKYFCNLSNKSDYFVK